MKIDIEDKMVTIAVYKKAFKMENVTELPMLKSDWGIKYLPYSISNPVKTVMIDNGMYIQSKEKAYLYENANMFLKGVKRQED